MKAIQRWYHLKMARLWNKIRGIYYIPDSDDQNKAWCVSSMHFAHHLRKALNLEKEEDRSKILEMTDECSTVLREWYDFAEEEGI